MSFRYLAPIVAPLLLNAAAAAEKPAPAYPTKPVRLLVPAPPGGSTDLIARIVGAKLVKAAGIKLD